MKCKLSPRIKMHSFTTERLLIRPLAEQDKAMYISLYTNAKIMRNICKPLSIEQADKAFNKSLIAMVKEKPKVITWAIVTLNDNKAIGIQALSWKNSQAVNYNEEKMHVAEIGIMLLRTCNGRLIPKEATGALVEYAFKYLALKKINVFYSKRNIIIAKITQSLGLTYNQAKQPLDEKQALQYIEKKHWQHCFIKSLL